MSVRYINFCYHLQIFFLLCSRRFFSQHKKTWLFKKHFNERMSYDTRRASNMFHFLTERSCMWGQHSSRLWPNLNLKIYQALLHSAKRSSSVSFYYFPTSLVTAKSDPLTQTKQQQNQENLLSQRQWNRRIALLSFLLPPPSLRSIDVYRPQLNGGTSF